MVGCEPVLPRPQPQVGWDLQPEKHILSHRGSISVTVRGESRTDAALGLVPAKRLRLAAPQCICFPVTMLKSRHSAVTSCDALTPGTLMAREPRSCAQRLRVTLRHALCGKWCAQFMAGRTAATSAPSTVENAVRTCTLGRAASPSFELAQSTWLYERGGFTRHSAGVSSPQAFRSWNVVAVCARR